MDHLGLPDIRHPEHELQRSVAPRDHRAVADEDGARAVLGVRDAREDDPQRHRVQQLPVDDFQRDQPGAQPAVPGPPPPISCAPSFSVQPHGR